MGVSLERSHNELAALADEQAGLRRVATLVAQGASADDVHAAVACEIGQLLPADYALIGRYDLQGTEFTTVANWSREGESADFPTALGVGGRNVTALVWQTGSAVPHRSRRDRLRARRSIPSCAGHPVDGRRPHQRRRTPVGHRDRRVQPRATDAGRHRDPARELHRARLDCDREHRGASGARRITRAPRGYRRRDQTPIRTRSPRWRPATIRRGRAVRVRAAQAVVPPDLPELAAELDHTAAELTRAIDELRDFAHGIHPAILVKGGLRPALRALVRRSAVPVDLDVRMNGRLPERVEVAAYYVVSEALTNAAKHGHPSSVTVWVEVVSRPVASRHPRRRCRRRPIRPRLRFGWTQGPSGSTRRRDHIAERASRGHIAFD